MVYVVVYKLFTLTIVFVASQYLQNLQTARLAIEKNVVAKQNDQLNEYLQSQKNAVIMYQLKDADDKPLYDEGTTPPP